ncbi:hypothetical protein L6278_02105 [Candidatus Parcubacteria bacterium]|nr:hypothetical protein [Patescibacteria group bacterium]MBU4482453.1 hypothetical protein [Patescibacteria group bacterium]MCG2686911.1 hypothetical protein [Candidatus Parcubacteria bacterium]
MLKTTLKLFFSILLLIIAGYLFYKNFIKNDNVYYIPPNAFEIEQVYSKFDIDVLENKVFKELKQVKQVNALISDTTDIGRSNPFISF